MKSNSSKPRQKFSVHNYEQRKPFKKKPKEEKASGLGVVVHGDDITKALRIFKKKILKADILNEARYLEKELKNLYWLLTCLKARTKHLHKQKKMLN